MAKRHDAVEALKDTSVQKALKRFSDVERITARLALRSVRPRELAGLRDSLKLLPELRQALPDATPLLKELIADLARPKKRSSSSSTPFTRSPRLASSTAA